MKGSGGTSRALMILRQIPRFPRKLSTPEVWQKLRDEGHELTLRSVQRSINDLSVEFGLGSEMEGRTQYWFWPANFGNVDIPGLTPQQALVFELVKTYLEPALPQTYVGELDGYFKQAALLLKTAGSRAAKWNKFIRVIEHGPRLEVPKINQSVSHAIHEALLNDRRANLVYLKRGEFRENTFEVNVHGLVIRKGLVYLVVSIGDYENVVQIVMHRIRKAEVLEKPATRVKGFDLDRYIREDMAFSYPEDHKKEALKMVVDSGMAEHLAERPLADDQQLRLVDDGQYELKATVRITSELRWWILGFGDSAEVVSPKSLRVEMASISNRMAKRYKAL